MKTLLFITIVLSLCYLGSATYAHCYLRGTDADPGVYGYVKFTLNDDGTIHMEVNAHNITVNPDSLHGVHVHEFGDLTNKTTTAPSVGGHWLGLNPNHGCPLNASRHYGDTGNWNVTGGVISGSKDLDLLALTGNFSIIGRAVVIHATTDDCVNVPSSGSRLAFCVIGVGNDTVNNASIDRSPAVTNAICTLQPVGSNAIYGVVTFSQPTVSSAVTVTAKIYGLVNGSRHGFHVHQYGDLSDNVAAQSVGSHYNPNGFNHYIPGYNDSRHMGDMGNIYYYDTDGVAYYQYVNTIMTLNGPNNILGRAAVVHQNEDLCNVPSAAGRWAYCVIGIQNPTTTVNFINGIPTTQDTQACEPATTTGATTAGTTAATSGATTDASSTDATTTGSAGALGVRYSEMIAAVFFCLLLFIAM